MTNQLTANKDAVEEILLALEYENISFDNVKRTFRFAREYGRNPSSIVLYLDTLQFYCFSTSEKGNIYTIAMEKLNKNFPRTLEWIANKLEIETDNVSKQMRLPFGGFYKNLIKEIQEPEYNLNILSEEILDTYNIGYSKMFFDDGIDFETQDKFQIGYDIWSNRITIPVWRLDGKLCGVMGRLNDENCAKEDRWFPIIPCSRSLTLFGYHQNYEKIQQKGLCIVSESEKSVMKLSQMGCYNSVALGKCSISETQAKYLKALLISKYIVCLDEGIEEEQIIEECNKLKINNAIHCNKVGYVFDKDNKYLPKGSKLSPCDMPKEVFSTLIKEFTKWI